MHKLEYLWLDGCTPTQIRSKTKIVKDFGIDGDEYEPNSSITKTVKVPGRDFTVPVFEFIQKGVMHDLLEMKWADIMKALNGK